MMTEVSEQALPWVAESDLAYGEQPRIHDADGRLIAVVGNAETERQDQWEAHAALIVQHVNAAGAARLKADAAEAATEGATAYRETLREALAARPSPTGEKVEAPRFAMTVEHGWVCAREAEKGSWVRYTDHAATIAALEAERDEARKRASAMEQAHEWEMSRAIREITTLRPALAAANARVERLEANKVGDE